MSILSEGGRAGQSSLLKGATPEMLRKYLPDGTFPLETQVFLVRMPGKNILIDAGYGTNLFQNLQSLNVTAEQIDVVLLTHLHGDHIGGLFRDGQIAFPNAEMHLSRKEYEYWMANERGENARKALEAYKNKLHLFDPPQLDEPMPEQPIQPIAAYGHTPGHTAYLIRSDENKWLIWGDLTHATPIQMPCPDVALTFDVDPEQAIQTRKAFFEYASKQPIVVGGMHVPFPAAGHVSTGQD